MLLPVPEELYTRTVAICRLLAENGGPVALTKDWIHYLLVQMEYVKRKANSKVKVVPENFAEHRVNFCVKLRGL